MPNKVAELYAEFKVDFQKSTMDVLNTSLGELKLSTIAEISSLAGLTRMLFSVGNNALKTASHLHMLGAVYGLNTQGLQNMERAGLAANVSTEKMEASVIGLQNNLAGLQLGQVSSGFLEAAGRFGLNIGPGVNADQMIDQLMKTVPQFVKAHGAMGKSMASLLLSNMGVDPEMIQYLMKGQKFTGGQNIKDPTIEALTTASSSMAVLGFDIKNLASNSIAPLAELLGAIAGLLEPIAAVAGGFDNLAHPWRTTVGLASSMAGKWDAHANYLTEAQMRQGSAYYKAETEMRKHPFQGMGGFIKDLVLGKPGGPAGDVHNETNITIQGSADAKTVALLDKKMAAVAQKSLRDNAIYAGTNNPTAY